MKENHHDRGSRKPNTSIRGGGCGSYKEKLLGVFPAAYEQAFALDNDMETDMEMESDDETSDLSAGIAAVNLSGERKEMMRGPWTNSLIVKVFGKSVGYQFLVSRLGSMWKTSGMTNSVDLGSGFLLVRFTLKEDYIKVLSGGPWFVSGHYLSIRRWEPNFKPSTASVSSVAVWVRLPELPIEYYEPSVL